MPLELLRTQLQAEEGKKDGRFGRLVNLTTLESQEMRYTLWYRIQGNCPKSVSVFFVFLVKYHDLTDSWVLLGILKMIHLICKFAKGPTDFLIRLASTVASGRLHLRTLLMEQRHRPLSSWVALLAKTW